jgi:radical SAM superfamily enzyme YgiQ (UPF0313 family)
MMSQNLVQLGRTTKSPRGGKSGRVLLVKPPFFTPWAPPLGIAILKTYLEKEGYSVRCFDYNTDSFLWGTHHKYFAALQSLEEVTMNDGYSKLWWIFNAHMLAYANRADDAACAMVLEKIAPLYNVRLNKSIRESLLGIVRAYFKRLEELTDRLDLSDVSVAGTSTYTTSLSSSLFILRRIKERKPDVMAVMGGGIFADDLAIGSDNLETLLKEYDFIDHVILGEGEVLFHKLLEGELTSRMLSIENIKGATLNMKDVPVPDFSDLASEHYYHLTIEGARSCPFQCSFCSETIQWGEYRKKPMELFADQLIEMAKKYNNNEFFLGDSLMNPYIFQLSNELTRRKANILYDGYLRADKPVMSREKVKLWARSGCYRARLGIESASSRVLEAMDKMTTPKVISEALKSLANAGIRTTTYWIVGFPGETEEDFQETVEFIREHNRYIYELEAHPYYYYPYGQVGSRFHQCDSLYPEEVIDVIKFRVWEINDVKPDREERYRRLFKLSKLASDMGLPNIYTMAERYAAEERWQRLYPLVTEVYQGTLQRRSEVDLSEQVDRAPQECAVEGHDFETGGPSSVLCYRATVKRRLDETLLSRALEHVFKLNDILQVGSENGSYVPASGSGADNRGDIIHVFDLPADGQINSLCKEIVEGLSKQMRPEPRTSLKVVLIRSAENVSDLLLLAHSDLADTKTVSLLFEDMFRAYEQLSSGMEVSLIPVKKSYLSLFDEPGIDGRLFRLPPSAARPASNGDHPGADEKQSICSSRISLDHSLIKQLESHTVSQAGLAAGDLFAIALLRILAREAPESVIDITVDYRLTDPELERTVGPLTAISQLDLGNLDERELNSPAKMRDLLRGITRTEAQRAITASKEAATGRMLLNLQYLAEAPWIGGDDWIPWGFVVYDRPSNADYLVEVVPVVKEREIEVLVWHRKNEQASNIVEKMGRLLAVEVDSVLRYCDDYAAAKWYWRSEFGKGAPESNIETVDNRMNALDQGKASMPCDVRMTALDILGSECSTDLSATIIAAYAALLSRLSGREDVVVLYGHKRGKDVAIAPVRVYPSWNTGFREFTHQVRQKISKGIKYAPFVFDVLTETRCFDVACLIADSKADAAELENLLKESQAGYNKTVLALEVIADRNDSPILLVYTRSRFHQGLVEKLGSCLGAIIDEATKNPDIAIGDIQLESESKSYNVATVLAEEMFNF